jgi:hypothetical protein
MHKSKSKTPDPFDLATPLIMVVGAGWSGAYWRPCLSALIIVIAYFGYFVWPTPYSHGQGIGEPGGIGAP